MAEDTQRFSDGTAYEQFMGRWTRAIGTIFLDWLTPPADARWLDIGCGTGVFTDLIVSTCSPATVVAIDPSEPQIEIARKKAIAQRVDFRVEDSQKLPFSDHTFDIVDLQSSRDSSRDRSVGATNRNCAQESNRATSGFSG